MPIPEDQLETWSRQGSVTQSSQTYGIIRTALERADSPYSAKSYKVFLQGSYGNDTNIYSESDVDVAIRLDSTFLHDIDSLPNDQQDALDAAYAHTTYPWSDFQRDVTAHLRKVFEGDAVPGRKAVHIKARGNRRSADVLIAADFRRYRRFRSIGNEDFVEGLCFFTSEGSRVANYPERHSANVTAKHQATKSWFKPVVRIFKNVRRHLVESGAIGPKTAPSYFIEGMLYNAPDRAFGGSYSESFVECFNWLNNTDSSQLVCANEQYYLLGPDSNINWSDDKFREYLRAVSTLWKNW